MRRLVISCPFGNVLRFPGTTSTMGTYTALKRAGRLKRLWRVLRTVRYSWRTQLWVNRLGLPSPGISSCPPLPDDCILSIHGFDRWEWVLLSRMPSVVTARHVELNLSCPNVESQPQMLQGALDVTLAVGDRVIAKLPPVRWMDLGEPLYVAGVRCFHLCNTMGSPGGGISGKPLMQYSLWAISDFRKHFGDTVTLIGGGGVTCLDDFKRYVDAGADHVAVGSMLFNPFNWRKIPSFVEYLEGVPWQRRVSK